MKQLYIFIIATFLIFSTKSFAQNISTLYGTTEGYSGDGNLAVNAQFDGPTDLTYDTNGNLFFVDGQNSVVRKIDTNGIISTIAGNGTPGYSGDGGLATEAQLYVPYGIVFDSNNNLYISEIGNNVIRKIDANGIISTIAGNGIQGYFGDGGLATDAQLNGPFGITFDNNNNLYIGERYNNVIRKIDTNGIITTIAGNGTEGYSGDGGPATSALLYGCRSVTFNDNGDLYIADGNNHVIRKIDTNGIISTIVGNGIQGYFGDGDLAINAQINYPRIVIFDNYDNFYFSESSSHVIRKVDNTGVITTVAGNGTSGYSGDGGIATNAQLKAPFGMILDSKDAGGNLVFSDNNNNVIRKIDNLVIDNTLNIEKLTNVNDLKISPNPSHNYIYISGLSKRKNYSIYNTLGSEIKKGVISEGENISINNFSNGLYFLKLDKGNTIKFIKK
jgi:sugar lactone lactonase YvrE